MARWIGVWVALVCGLACVQEPAKAPQVATKSASPAATAPIRIDVWHDTVCPWCRIGLHNLDAVVDAWDGAPLDVVFHPYLLEPDMPPEGADLRERLGRKYGLERVEAMFGRVTQAGAAYGIRFDFSKVQRTPSTVGSHALVEWSPPDRRDAVVEELHRAYFEEGRDIGDADVLAEIARAAGLDGAAARAAVTDPERLARVRSAASVAAQRGIGGVPHFVIGGRALHGAQSPEALRNAIRAAAGG